MTASSCAGWPMPRWASTAPDAPRPTRCAPCAPGSVPVLRERGQLRPYFLRHWKALAGAMLATAVTAMAELAAPWPLKLVIDRVLGDHPRPFHLTNDDLVL